ncbi:uncharacterized protein A4U43_C05F17280 [Asparagus officinalis]|uniref:Uncharacterized protein n=1 Tax=Asparagus officinalis TaxID=4686 RepID=A0A5P1EUS6_ASPOF|nr:uncharacterized protein A4U43_C05F17280 [Asparagus officinalis]
MVGRSSSSKNVACLFEVAHRKTMPLLLITASGGRRSSLPRLLVEVCWLRIVEVCTSRIIEVCTSRIVEVYIRSHGKAIMPVNELVKVAYSTFKSTYDKEDK